mmetsp:Transcript_12460/g.36734  ORF Transcript_12460/g.36734 Transcript_12460/m.36734 type:complete len:206 (-) Transcript_12460:90-707(-)
MRSRREWTLSTEKWREPDESPPAIILLPDIARAREEKVLRCLLPPAEQAEAERPRAGGATCSQLAPSIPRLAWLCFKGFRNMDMVFVCCVAVEKLWGGLWNRSLPPPAALAETEGRRAGGATCSHWPSISCFVLGFSALRNFEETEVLVGCDDDEILGLLEGILLKGSLSTPAEAERPRAGGATCSQLSPSMLILLWLPVHYGID